MLALKTLAIGLVKPRRSVARNRVSTQRRPARPKRKPAFPVNLGRRRKGVYSALRRNRKRQSGLAGETAELLHKQLPDIGSRRRCQEGVYRNFLNSTVPVKP
jgi:hypothetical protein